MKTEADAQDREAEIQVLGTIACPFEGRTSPKDDPPAFFTDLAWRG
jgi:hypothetical protein